MKKQWVITIYLEAEDEPAAKYYDRILNVDSPVGVSVSDTDLEEIWVPLK